LQSEEYSYSRSFFLLIFLLGMLPISIPLDESKNHDSGGTEASLCLSKVCRDRVQGWDCGDDVASWLCDALGCEGLRLVRQWMSDSRVMKGKQKVTGQGQFCLVTFSCPDFLLI